MPSLQPGCDRLPPTGCGTQGFRIRWKVVLTLGMFKLRRGIPASTSRRSTTTKSAKRGGIPSNAHQTELFDYAQRKELRKILQSNTIRGCKRRLPMFSNEFFKRLKKHVVETCAKVQANQALHHMTRPLSRSERLDQGYLNKLADLIPAPPRRH